MKKPAQLTSFFTINSVGRGATLLNVPPNRDGLLSPEDVAALKAFGDYRRATFSNNLATQLAKVTASNVRGKARAYAAANMLNGRADACWATDDAVLTADATFDFGRPVTFSVIRLREDIRLGQRIDAVAVEQWRDAAWQPLTTATSIGPRRLIRLEKPVETSRVRLRVTQASASPAIREFAKLTKMAGRVGKPRPSGECPILGLTEIGG